MNHDPDCHYNRGRYRPQRRTTTGATTAAARRAPAPPSAPTHARATGVDLTVDVGSGGSVECHARGDLGRDHVALQIRDADNHQLLLRMTGTTLVDLYLELRRYLGELGGHGPTREQAHRAIDDDPPRTNQTA